MIDPSSRGCPKCARNLDAERMIDKLVILGLLVGGTLMVLAIVFFYLRY